MLIFMKYIFFMNIVLLKLIMLISDINEYKFYKTWSWRESNPRPNFFRTKDTTCLVFVYTII